MNYKGILFFLGIYSLFISFFSVLNILYSFYFNFVIGLSSYIYTLEISIIIGLLFCYLGYGHHKNISLIEQILFIILSFLFIPLLISIPFFLSIYDINFINSYFEAVSGISATGFSIIPNIQDIDEPLLLWRSSSQWLGGLFFLIAIIGTIGSRQIKIKPSYLLPDGNLGENFYNNFYYNFFKILSIYFSSTVVLIFIYSLINIRLLDSFNLAFTVISSGGFIPNENLSNIINKDLQIFIFSLTLLIPIFNFYLLFNIFTRKFRFKNHQEDLHLALLIIFLTLIIYFFALPNEGIASILLYITSSISTSGIVTDISNYNLAFSFILLTIIGGSLVSVSSGFKYIRFYILLKVAYQEIYRLAKPIHIFNKNLFNTESKITEQDSKIAFLVFILFILSIFLLTSILTLDILSFENAFKLSMLTLTNTTASSLYGLGNLVFFDLNSISKVSLIVFMILGKIEIVAVLYLIKKLFFRE